jgi:hypothetical protein
VGCQRSDGGLRFLSILSKALLSILIRYVERSILIGCACDVLISRILTIILSLF